MKNQTRRRAIFILFIGYLLGFFSVISYGDNTSSITVKVTIVAPPPCTINDNKPVVVSFDDVLTTRIDGNNYRRKIPYNLKCTEANLLKNALKLQIEGTSINVGTAIGVLAVPNVPDFGIRIQQGTTPLPLNSWLNFNYPNMPELYAVPVMKEGSSLTTGEFTSSSVMKVEYQ